MNPANPTRRPVAYSAPRTPAPVEEVGAGADSEVGVVLPEPVGKSVLVRIVLKSIVTGVPACAQRVSISVRAVSTSAKVSSVRTTAASGEFPRQPKQVARALENVVVQA